MTKVTKIFKMWIIIKIMISNWQNELRNGGNWISVKISGKGLLATSLYKLGSRYTLLTELSSLVINFLK